MYAMQIAPEGEPTTIGELRQYLVALEAEWSEEGVQYLGEFDDQALYMDTGKGVAYATFQYVAEFGLVA
jgi:hypothetical protein